MKRALFYKDPIVSLFLSAESKRAANAVAVGFPAMKEMVKIRTRYFDDVLERELSSGCRQVVLLGAGLDTRAIRKSAPDVMYFEIDDGATLAMKRARLQKLAVRPNIKFIAANYVTDGLIKLLLANGFDPALSTYIIWEGNTMYLSSDSNKAIMEQLRDNLRNFHLSFDYLAGAVITKTTGEAGMARMAQNFANIGAPWVTGFDDISTIAGKVKLRVIDNLTTDELHRAYRHATRCRSHRCLGPITPSARLQVEWTADVGGGRVRQRGWSAGAIGCTGGAPQFTSNFSSNRRAVSTKPPTAAENLRRHLRR